MKATVCTAFGIIGGAVARLFGGWTEDIITLVIFMAIDFAMGLILAGVFKNSSKSSSGALDSRAGWEGLCKKGTILLFVLIAHRLDLLLDTAYIKTAAIIGFIINESISIIENAGLMGIPLPDVVAKAIEMLRNMEGDTDENN
ncbi:MAG: phage holin family protein [Clostridia bacterium]|nr:phage holin family protein [Clostridia bacterium]